MRCVLLLFGLGLASMPSGYARAEPETSASEAKRAAIVTPLSS